ncbi:MAG: hypothetical protein AAGA68_10835 [Pseudomonadota bacterium]
MRAGIVRLVALSLMVGVICGAAGATPTPALRAKDRVRLAEAFALAAALADLWPGWDEVPFAVLLVTDEDEFLVRHPSPPAGEFQPLGHDPLLAGDVLHRPASGRFSPEILATFPAFDSVNTVVVGTPERTGKSSTQWVLTLLHERFHQWQFSGEGYFTAVEKLDLSGGDDSGMWQLNYRFAYEDRRIAQALDRYRAVVAKAVVNAADGNPVDVAKTVVDARERLREAMTPADYRYFDFQLWQEGVARYTELLVAREAAHRHTPSEAFRKLADVVSYAQALTQLKAQLASELTRLDLARHRRLVFYPLGAQEALLLDVLHPDWRKRYYAHKFSLGTLLPRGMADPRVVQ